MDGDDEAADTGGADSAAETASGDAPDGGHPALAERRDLDTVYQPAEDSRLLAEAAIEAAHASDRVLEVGSGSGYVAERIATETDAGVVAVDVNPDACRQTRDRGIPAVQGDLVGPFADRQFDVVCSNPPYLPTPPEQEWDDRMEAALSGGESGRAVVDRFLHDVGRVLAPDGMALLLVSTLTDLDAVREEARRQGFEPTPVRDESYPFERLVVFRLAPTTGD